MADRDRGVCLGTVSHGRRSTLWSDIAPNSMPYSNGVTVSFDGFKALNNLSLTVEPGEMRAIIGPNSSRQAPR